MLGKEWKKRERGGGRTNGKRPMMTATPPTKVACRVATIGQGHANKFLQQWQQLHLLRSSSHRVVASQAQIFNLTTWPLQNRPIKSISIASGRWKTRRGGATTPPSMTKNKTKGKQRKKQQNNNNTNNKNNNNLVVALDSSRVEFPSLVSNKESEHILCLKQRSPEPNRSDRTQLN